MHRTRVTALCLAVTMALVVASCGGGDGADKAGASHAPRVLRLANTNGALDFTPAVVDFAERVKELSGGRLRVEAVNEWGGSAPDAEQQVVNDVAAGEIDLGWVGTRVFDTLGVESFQALTAPLLIDSYALEGAVIESGITAQMLRGLDGLGVAGLAVLPDGLRKPIGVAGPLGAPADWRGITFGTPRSNGQVQAIRALGAAPAQIYGEQRVQRLRAGTIQGFETSVWVHQHNPALIPLAPYVTANVTLWPQMDVLLANPTRLAALTGEQREWLEQAARYAAGRSDALAAIDAHRVGDSCMGGARFAQASDTDLAALEAAFAPVYAKLRQQPETKAFIDRIQALKRSTPPEPALAIPSGCTGAAPERPAAAAGSATARLNGTYRYQLTQKDADAVGDTDTGYPSVTTIRLRDGEFKGGCFGSIGGSYAVDDDRITFHSLLFDADFTVTFSVDDRGNLRLTPVPPMDAGDAFNCFYKPWQKID